MYKFRLLVQRGTCLTIILAMLGGCEVGPNFDRPAAPDTDRYTHELQSEATVEADGQSQYFTSSNTLIADWWKLFGSAVLNAILNKAIANNPTLQASEASLRQSQDSMRAGYGVFFPQIQAGVGVSRQRAASQSQGLQTGSKIFNLITLSSTVSYAIDVFGGARRSVESLREMCIRDRFIIGPSGSGKTTLLSMISGILRPNEGKVSVKGADIWRLSNDQLADFRLHTIGFVFQDYHLFPRLTTAENVAIPLILKQQNWNESVTEAKKYLEIVGLKDKGEILPVKLSGGEQQRVAIARAIIKMCIRDRHRNTQNLLY